MSDDTIVDGEAGTEALEKEALTLGWAPKDQWRGKEEDWVDAETFVTRGREVMPMLKKNNERLLGKVTQTETQLKETLDQLKAVQTSLKLLEEHREADVEAQVKARMAALRSGIAEASRDGDHERVAELTEELAEAKVAAVKPAEKPKADDQETQPKMHPEVQAWYMQNPQYINDPRRRALGDAVAIELRNSGDTTVGAEFLNKIKDEVEKTLGGGGTAHSKVAGGNGGGGRSAPASGGGKSYADLPKDAKEVCDRMATRFVGTGKKFSDNKAWQAEYAKTYFSQE